VIGATGGAVDFSGATAYTTHFAGSGAGITASGNSTWTGGGISRIENDTNALLPITLNSASTAPAASATASLVTAAARCS